MWILYIIIGVVILSFFVANNSKKDENSRLISQGIDPNNFISAGKYLSGHIMLDQPKENTFIYPGVENLKIYATNKVTLQKDYLADIPVAAIENISIEDESSIQSRVGLKRMLALGIFAFAVKKKIKSELGYVVIEWKDGKFTHETVFEFEGPAAISRGNTLRNRLIKAVNNPESEASGDNLRNDMIQIINQGSVLKAVKAYHDRTGASLRDSKNYIDNLLQEIN